MKGHAFPADDIYSQQFPPLILGCQKHIYWLPTSKWFDIGFQYLLIVFCDHVALLKRAVKI